MLNGVDKRGNPKDICDLCETLRENFKESKVEDVPKDTSAKPERKKTSDIEAEMDKMEKMR